MGSGTVALARPRSPAFWLLGAVCVTLLLLFAYDKIPEERFVVAGNARFQVSVQSHPIPGVQTPGTWVNEAARHFRCQYPEGVNEPGYYCALNFTLSTSSTMGLDLSRFERVEMVLRYTGTKAKLRLFARNYNPHYSKPADPNSTKYNAVLLASEDQGQLVSVNVNEFIVSEWWRDLYKVSRNLAQPELTNVVTMGIDYAFPMVAGNHEVQVQRLEFVRKRIARDHWYLTILCLWLGTAALYAVSLLRFQRARGSALKREAQRYRALATIDPLTQALNRHGLEQRWAKLSQAASDNDAELSQAQALIVVDIDHFKGINDSRGHDAGDRVLRRLSSLIQRNLRSTDHLARWGGEEFVVLLPSVLAEHVPRIAESIRAAVAANVFEPDNPLHVTVSLGLAVRKGDEPFDALFKRADEALYAAKAAGRNRVVVADQPSG